MGKTREYKTNTPFTVGLTGPAGSGKDSVADILCSNYGFVRMSFASPLKAAVKIMFGLTESHVNGALKERPIRWLKDVTPRHIMQTLGTEWGREHICDDVWIRVADMAHASILDQTPCAKIVVTDVRFDNEARWVRQQGGSVWHIQRPIATHVRKHASEDGVAFYPATDRRLRNTGTLDDLRRTVEGVCSHELARS